VAATHALVFALGQEAFQKTLAHDLKIRSRLEAALSHFEDVKTMPLFQDLQPAELDLMLVKLQPVSASPGQAIVRQGEPGDRFYVIRSGRVEVLKDGRFVAALGRGEAFGEIALLLDVPRTATVRAVEHTELLSLEASDFRDLLVAYCGQAGRLEEMSRQRLDALNSLQ